MPRPDERFLLANGLRHHVLVWNDGARPTVVLCHGFLDQAWSFAEVADALVEGGMRVVAFDWRGHGETDHVGAGGYYHFPDYVLDLHALMPFLAAGEVHLVGHSMGGTACAYYAATHPRVLETLTLIEGLGPPTFTGEAPDKVVAWLESMDRLQRRDARPMVDLAEAVKRMRLQNPDLPTARAYALAETGTRPADPETEGEGLMWRFDPLHRTTSPGVFDAATFRTFLARIECPTLVVTGGRGFTTEDHAERVSALLDAREVTIPGVGHMIHQLAPDALAARVLEHVAGSG